MVSGKNVAGDTVLKDKDGKEIKAESLWSESPVLVIVLRRPGCLLCRDQAITIWKNRDTLPKEMRLVCVLHEWKEREVEAFYPEYWGGELYYDESKAFYAAVHGGQVKKGSLLALLNPFGRAFSNMKRSKKAGQVKDSNLVGDGLTLGGLMIFKQGGDVAYSFAEETFGDHAPFDIVVSEAAKAM